MTTTAEIVIVGCGVVGASTAYHLALLGKTDVLVLDAGPLFATGGSSSHAPGLVFQTNPSRSMTHLARATVELYSSLELDGEPCFHPVGGIEVATTPARLAELHRRQGWATSWGLGTELLSPGEVAAKEPLVDPGRILGGYHVPSDGLANAVRGVEAMARAAQARGIGFAGDTEVTGVEVEDSRIRALATTRGRIEAGTVVLCAGIWGPEIGRMAGVSVPVQPLAHQYALTGPVPALADVPSGTEVTHPILRHQDRALYFRQVGDRYGIGSYHHRAIPVSTGELASHATAAAHERVGVSRWSGPSVHDFTPEDFGPAWDAAVELLPPLSATGVADAMNGLFLFTSDGMPVLGPSRRVRGLWLAEAVWVTHSGGVGQAMAEWIAEGRPGVDLREADVHRFHDWGHAPAYVAERSAQNFREVYDIVHPLQPPERPRPLRVAPFHARTAELGAVYLPASGWERPQWYEANAPLLDDLDEIPARDAWSARHWSPIAAAEARVTRERVAMFDMSTLTRATVSGPGALGLLEHLTTNRLDNAPGYVTYTLMLDHDGGIRSDVTVARLGRDEFQVGLNGPRDVEWLTGHAPADAHVTDVTGGTTCVGLWGPAARDVLAAVSPDDVTDAAFGFFRARRIFVGEVPVTALRLSYVGELGWELYCPADLGLRLWDLLWEAGQAHGIITAGRSAFNALRLEKGYRSWGTDMWSDHTPAAAGVGFAVRKGKGPFLGREALLRRGEPAQRLACLTLDDPRRVVLGSEPVYRGNEPVGFVTSADQGWTCGASIAYAWLPAAIVVEGTPVTVGWFDERLPATVSTEPLVDPEMKRMRG